jgi:hypothetical protein
MAREGGGWGLRREAAVMATVRPLGPWVQPVRSWVGLGVVRGVQLAPWAAGFSGW